MGCSSCQLSFDNLPLSPKPPLPPQRALFWKIPSSGSTVALPATTVPREMLRKNEGSLSTFHVAPCFALSGQQTRALSPLFHTKTRPHVKQRAGVFFFLGRAAQRYTACRFAEKTTLFLRNDRPYKNALKQSQADFAGKANNQTGFPHKPGDGCRMESGGIPAESHPPE